MARNQKKKSDWSALNVTEGFGSTFLSASTRRLCFVFSAQLFVARALCAKMLASCGLAAS